MNKINNNLIGLFAILAFVFGPIGINDAFARTVTVKTGAYFTPTVYPTVVTTNTTNTTNNTNNSTNQNTNQNNTNTSTSSNTSSNTRDTTVNASSTRTVTTRSLNLNNRVPEMFVTSNYGTNRYIDISSIGQNMPSASEVNANYGRLTASAIAGSNSFWPTGIFQWILVFIILIIMITLFRYVRRSKEIYMTAPAKHA